MLRVAVLPEWSDHWWLPTFLEPYRDELVPGVPRTTYQANVAGDWIRRGRELIELTDLGSADLVVLSFGLEAQRGVDRADRGRWVTAALQTAVAAADAGKCVLAFCAGDQHVETPGPNAVVWRTSLSTRTQSATDLPMPAFVADPAVVVAPSPRPWQPVPTVSFTGQAYPLGVTFDSPTSGALKWAKAVTRMGLSATPSLAARAGIEPIHPARVLAVASLRRSHAVDAQVRLQQTVTRLDLDLDADRQRHRDFLEDIGRADYVLAPRGLGNYSYRFYEALSVGRVPVVVDTGAPLPCSELSWSELAVTVPMRRVPSIGGLIAARHRQEREGWTARQEGCRAVWQSSLSAAGFFDRLVSRLASLGADGLRDAAAIAAVAA